MSIHTPSLRQLYRYLTRGPTHNDPVDQWLEHSETAATELASMSAQLAAMPQSDEPAMPESDLIATIENSGTLSPAERTRLTGDILNSHSGREALDMLTYAAEEAAAQPALDLDAVVARADARVAAQMCEPVPFFRCVVEHIADAARDLIILVQIPPMQLELAASYRGAATSCGNKVNALLSCYENGDALSLTLKRHDDGSLHIRLQYQMHYEERELVAATLNGEPMRIVDGEAEATVDRSIRALRICATASEGAVHRLTCAIDEG